MSQQSAIGTIQDDATIAFVNSKDAGRLAELGTSCPDHSCAQNQAALRAAQGVKNKKLDDAFVINTSRLSRPS